LEEEIDSSLASKDNQGFSNQDILLESANLELKKIKSDLKNLQREKQTWVLMQQSGIVIIYNIS
jgi:hypothetical protein